MKLSMLNESIEISGKRVTENDLSNIIDIASWTPPAFAQYNALRGMNGQEHLTINNIIQRVKKSDAKKNRYSTGADVLQYAKFNPDNIKFSDLIAAYVFGFNQNNPATYPSAKSRAKRLLDHIQQYIIMPIDNPNTGEKIKLKPINLDYTVPTTLLTFMDKRKVSKEIARARAGAGKGILGGFALNTPYYKNYHKYGLFGFDTWRERGGRVTDTLITLVEIAELMFVLFGKWKRGEPLTGVTEFFKEKFKDDKEIEADIYKDMGKVYSADPSAMEYDELSKSDEEDETEAEIPADAGIGVEKSVPEKAITEPSKAIEPSKTIAPSETDKPEKIPIKSDEDDKKKKDEEIAKEKLRKILKATENKPKD